MPRAIAGELLDDAGKPEVRWSGGEHAPAARPQPGKQRVRLGTALVQVSLAPLCADPASQTELTVRAPDGWSAEYEPEHEAWALRARRTGSYWRAAR